MRICYVFIILFRSRLVVRAILVSQQLIELIDLDAS